MAFEKPEIRRVVVPVRSPSQAPSVPVPAQEPAPQRRDDPAPSR
jgi:hypothetical protein